MNAIVSMNLFSICLVFVFQITLISKHVECQMDYYSTTKIRRASPFSSNSVQDSPEHNPYILAEFKNMIDGQARRRLERLLQLHQAQHSQQHYYNFNKNPRDTLKAPSKLHHHSPSFTYPQSKHPFPRQNDETVKPFAITPNDPRFNQQDDIPDDEIYDFRFRQPGDTGVNDVVDDIATDRQHETFAEPKIITPIKENLLENTMAIRDDIAELVRKMQHPSGYLPSVGAGSGSIGTMEVTRKEINTGDAALGVYVVGMIAGISAALTIGLIALAIGWYSLQKKAKAAADIEYPAYGVTGPNKDASPASGDRKLAQSAQIYHYQHQKQQIIALKNSGNVQQANHPTLSDAESDDENEEGDYTVYECPGLARTDELEVKNPLFLDDTPITASNDHLEPKATTATASADQKKQVDEKKK